jgi:hypothetical protein
MLEGKRRGAANDRGQLVWKALDEGLSFLY